jgi:hypothetical protein
MVELPKRRLAMRSTAVRLFLLTTLGVLGAASSATAFAVNMTARGSTSSLATSDTVTVDVFLDAEPGLALFAIGVILADDSALDYDPVASAAATRCATCIGPGTSGAQPSYILYTGGKPATILYPLQTPAFANWPGVLVYPGSEQLNLNYADASFNSATASGTNIWIATLVFEVSQVFSFTTLFLTMDAAGNVLAIDDGLTIVPPTAIGLSGPIYITGVIPEPGTATLLGLGLVGLGIARRGWR